MVVTEEEAKKSACCQIKQDLKKPTTPMSCGGADCMAWRWVSKGSTMGYCGLAGEPRELVCQ